MFLILALLLVAKLWAGQADMVIQGARIYTLDGRHRIVSALAIKDGKVLYAGDDASPYVGSSTRVLDAQGATLVPGFIDSHAHMEGLGEELESFDLRDVRTVQGVAAMVRQAAATAPAGQWIRGRSWDQTNWGGQFPTATDLDAAAPGHPVCLTRVDGHAIWVNSKALELASVTADTKDPSGGRIIRDKSGKPTGVLIDNAMGLVLRRIPRPTPEDTRRRLQRAARECVRLGLTTVHDAGISAQDLAAYRDLIVHDELPLRIYAMIGGPGPLWDRFLERGPEIGDRLTIRSVKLYADGALGSRGAALLEPYSDDPGNSGLLVSTREQIERVARQAAEHGFQVCTHAIGDRANRTVLDAYGSVLGGTNDRRFRIEHAQVVAPADFELFRKYSIIASMQATHATSDMRWAAARLGPERVKGAYAWRRFLALGVPLPDGSDFPVESPNPIWGFYAAFTRQDRAGNPPGGWFPDQRMTREEALRSWTLAGAYAAFEEGRKGSLEPGKLADFVMLSTDIMTAPPREVLGARVLMTVVGGMVVYSAER